MREELVSFVLENKLSPFSDFKVSTSLDDDTIFKTKDARAVYNRVLSQISDNFIFKDTSNFWNFFNFSDSFREINRRQNFFSSLEIKNSSYLKTLKRLKKTWKPQYDILVVTEDESSFIKLRELGCPVQLLVSENDCLDLERCDIVQVVDCDNFHMLLERLPQTVFLNSVEDAYLERYLEELSSWKDNYELLVNSKEILSKELRLILERLEELFNLMDGQKAKAITKERVEEALEEVNDRISLKIKEMTISGEGLLKILGEGKMPHEILTAVKTSISESGLNESLFNMQIPVSIDYKELEEQIKRQNSEEYTDLAHRIKSYSSKLKEIPTLLSYLSADLLVEDFCVGVSNWIGEGKKFPQESENLEMIDSSNIFLKDAQPISFQLTSKSRCSILTGANSGGKTTLLEHLIQNISLFHLGLSINGRFSSPIFQEVYYFAKNKGSASRGAFETLLSQMSKIKPGKKTLILADEIEAVTEPGVAGKIISVTADYFIKKDCFMVLATHLGYEICKNIPTGARIDGIEASGLDENFNLIVNHNPVLGKLAHSTPELIIERMAKSTNEEYFTYLYKNLSEKV